MAVERSLHLNSCQYKHMTDTCWHHRLFGLQKHVSEATAAHVDVQERIKRLAVDTEPLEQEARQTEATLAERKKDVKKIEVRWSCIRIDFLIQL